MHACTLLITFAAAGSAVADVGFGLYAFSTRSDNIRAWPVLNAHVGANDNVLTIERPSAYSADRAFIKGTDEQKHDQVARLAFCMSHPLR